MSRFDDYAQTFLTALYLETEESGREYHSARSIHTKYGLAPEQHWVSRMADQWEHYFFKDISKVLGGYDSWSFRLSSEGFSSVEQRFSDLDEVRSFLFGGSKGGTFSLRPDQVPASDRIVTFSDNQVATFKASVDTLTHELEKDNGCPEQIGLRERLLGQIKAGRELIVAGQFKAYLLYEVLVQALNEIIEKYGNETIKSLANALLGAIVAELIKAA